ncbi:MAG: hypothetical protein IJT64_02535 [Kiritimatiellae bacterium]|nr:hypothetical protein [Kiritimatiellia bacterium]
MSDKEQTPAKDAKPIPPPSIPEELLPVYDWYMTKGKDQLLVVAIAIVAVLAAVATVRYRDNQNAEASFALANANGVESLEGLSAKYSGTKVGQVISLRLAKAYYDQGDYAQAASLYATCAKKGRKGPLAPQARLGQASAIEAEAAIDAGSGDEAAAQEKLANASDLYAALAGDKTSSVYAEAAMGQARCLAALGDKDAASAVLDQLVIDAKDTRYEMMADALRKVIDRFEGFRNNSIFDRLGAIAGDAPVASDAEAVVTPPEEVEQVAPQADGQAAAEEATAEPPPAEATVKDEAAEKAAE